MIGYADAPMTWNHVRAMAQRAGFDVPRAVLDGWLTRAELGQIIAQCQKAGCTKGCMDVLAVPCDASAAPPAFCAIKEELQALAPDLPNR